MHQTTKYMQDHPLPTFTELEELIYSTKIFASRLIDILGIPKEFEEDAYSYARDAAQAEKDTYHTEVQLQCHFWQGTSNGPIHKLLSSANLESKISTVNHNRRVYYNSAFAPIMRVAELEVLRDDFFDISIEKAAADQAVLKMLTLFSTECSNYWVRNGAKISSDHTVDPSVITTARTAGFQHKRNPDTNSYERQPLWRASADVSLDHNYMSEVNDHNLCIVNCNGKTGFPLNAKPIPLPKKCDPSYELYASKVLVIFPSKIDGAETEAEALTGFSLEERYICVGQTNGGERIVSCSTTPGRAVGGVNVKTKNKVLDTLGFSF